MNNLDKYIEEISNKVKKKTKKYKICKNKFIKIPIFIKRISYTV